MQICLADLYLLHLYLLHLYLLYLSLLHTTVAIKNLFYAEGAQTLKGTVDFSSFSF